ncbi:DUF3105 domain-containing protein [Catellatospora chokoriensis]|uniref:Membrane protein n=1 Tax=Catellatospora chokoriensis TaxID=310353 RepID=A0A8J3JSX0_9ACTN|nr:DUF3105 domain-containing protein [Catellatospora chokoriensis]GIF87929.1 membrane protein [Catellatospora chokoriensis]
MVDYTNTPPKPAVPVWAWVVGGLVVLLCLCAGVGGVGYYVWRAQQKDTQAVAPTGTWQQQLAGIDGVRDYLTEGPLSQDHAQGGVVYPQQPPIGGQHNGTWQNCSGTVYDEPIASERAVHSLEHGAVWITYRPGIGDDDARTLAEKVSGRDYLMLSPFPGQDAPISLQAWGYQLKVDSADDPRIDFFVNAARQNAGPEIGAPCSGGTRQTGELPPAGTAA